MSRGLYPPSSSWWIFQEFCNYSSLTDSCLHIVVHLVLALGIVSLILYLSYLSSFTCSSYSVFGLFHTVHFPSCFFFFLSESWIIMWLSTNSLPLCRHQLSNFLQPQEILLLYSFPTALYPVLEGSCFLPPEPYQFLSHLYTHYLQNPYSFPHFCDIINSLVSLIYNLLELVDAQSLEAFEIRLNGALSNLIWKCPCSLQAISSPNCVMILFTCIFSLSPHFLLFPFQCIQYHKIYSSL